MLSQAASSNADRRLREMMEERDRLAAGFETYVRGLACSVFPHLREVGFEIVRTTEDPYMFPSFEGAAFPSNVTKRPIPLTPFRVTVGDSIYSIKCAHVEAVNLYPVSNLFIIYKDITVEKINGNQEKTETSQSN